MQGGGLRKVGRIADSAHDHGNAHGKPCLRKKLDAMWQTLADQTDKMLHHTEEFMNSKMQAVHEAVEKTLLGIPWTRACRNCRQAWTLD